MNSLKLNQSVLTLIGVCADEKNTPSRKKIRNRLIYAILLTMKMINFTANSLYFVKYVSTDYDEAIYGLLSATSVFAMFYILVTLRYHSEKLRSIFSTLDIIYKERKMQT